MKLIGRAIFVFSLAFSAGVTINSYRFGYEISDAFWRTLMAPVEGTIWAPEFDETKFSKIRIGMSTPEVIDLIGDPFRTDCGDKDCFWIYTKLEAGLPGYDQRWLVFDATKRVREIRKSFYLD